MADQLTEIMRKLRKLLDDPESGVTAQKVAESLPPAVARVIIDAHRIAAMLAAMNDPALVGVFIGTHTHKPEASAAILDTLARSVQLSIKEAARAQWNTAELTDATNRLNWALRVLKGLAWYVSREQDGGYNDYVISTELEERVTTMLLEGREMVNRHSDLTHRYCPPEQGHKVNLMSTEQLIEEFKAWFKRMRRDRDASEVAI